MFRLLFEKLIRLDFVMFFAMMFLLTWSCIFIHGIGVHCGGDLANFWWKQAMWVGIGLGVMFTVSLINYKILGEYYWLVYLAGCSLLILVLLIGKEINGAKSWIALGPITLQPAELAKPCALVITAWLMSKRMQNLEELSGWSVTRFIIPGVAATVPCFLILLQPDMGSAFIIVPIFASIAFVAGLPKRVIFLILFTITVSAVPIYKYGLKGYQRARIEVFLNPEKDITGDGWNQYQSILAVGSGGLHGKGLGNGTQYILGYLPRPVAPTDFIHSVISEETGFVGSCILIFTYLLITLRAVHIAAKSDDYYGKFLGVGFVAFLVTHCYINIGMTMGVAPIIGVPLPFVSYGGSFMLGCMIFMGLIQSVHIHSKLT